MTTNPCQRDWPAGTLASSYECTCGDCQPLGEFAPGEYTLLVDNQEWGNGFVPRLGLYEVDYDSGQRTLRDSGQYYAEVIRQSHAKKATA